MTLDLVGCFRDAWALGRRDRDLLIRIAALFLFLPQFAFYLIVPDPPARPIEAATATQEAWAVEFLNWINANLPWYLMVALFCYFGVLVILTLYAAPNRPTLAEAMLTSLRLFPRYVLAMLVVGLPVTLGLLLFIIPGFWVLGRLYLVGPLIVSRRPIGALAAITESVRRTRGNGLVLAGISGLALGGGLVLGQPFIWARDALIAAHAANPVAMAIVDAGAALAAALALLTMAMLQYSAMRRLAP